MEWDGSLLSNFTVKRRIRRGNITYWMIVLPNKDVEWCIARKINNPLPCIVDEIKPLFKLEKVGTHYCKFKGQGTFLLIKNHEHEDLISIYDTRMDCIREIQKIIVFRYVMGLSFPHRILMRNKTPVSYCIGEERYSNAKHFFSLHCYERFFFSITPSKVIRNLLEIENEREKFIKIKNKQREIKEEKITENKYLPPDKKLEQNFIKRTIKQCNYI